MDASYRWRLINRGASAPAENQTTAISADPLLSKVCKYYLNCLSLDNTNKISVFKDSQFTPEYVEINTLDVDSLNNEEALAFMRNTSQLGNKVMYIGYPASVYTITSRQGVQFKKIAPTFYTRSHMMLAQRRWLQFLSSIWKS